MIMVEGFLMGSESPAREGSTLGSRTPESRTLGSRTPGSPTLASPAMESPAMESPAMESPAMETHALENPVPSAPPENLKKEVDSAPKVSSSSEECSCGNNVRHEFNYIGK
ncbi:hypothetical protein TWF506_005941 [Arthrobotrys conoides]|uniref:Uncharacterized protein n=1 Tax=Arthrobotrys conoides TaxID=74498 RepID=A0AAN8NV08_9PEZI